MRYLDIPPSIQPMSSSSGLSVLYSRTSYPPFFIKIAKNVISKTFLHPLLWPNNALSQHHILALNSISDSNKSQLTFKPSSNSCLPTSTPTAFSCSCRMNLLPALFPPHRQFFIFLLCTLTHLHQPPRTIKLLMWDEAEEVESGILFHILPLLLPDSMTLEHSSDCDGDKAGIYQVPYVLTCLMPTANSQDRILHEVHFKNVRTTQLCLCQISLIKNWKATSQAWK